MELSDLGWIALALTFSAFFSGVEIAFVSANKLRIELQRKQGEWAGFVLSRLLHRQSQFIGTLLVGNTLALVLYGILMARLLEPWLQARLPDSLQHPIAILVIQTIISTLIVLPLAEFLPKSLFMANANRLLTLLAVPIQLSYWLLRGFVWVIIGLVKFFIVRILRQPFAEDQPVFRLTDVNDFIARSLNHSQDVSDPAVDPQIFNNAVQFRSLRVRDCMLPRTDIVAIEFEEGLSKLRDTFIESGYSKILVYRDSIDNIVGYCHSLALFRKPKTISDILSPIVIVPETLLASELLVQFINERRSIALVVDEFGGTAGIVTMEDVMEEIFGEIQDEHDEEALLEEQLDAHTYLLSGRLEVDYLNQKYGWQLPTGDYDTLGGLILAIHEDIPQLHEVVVFGPFTFEVLTLDEVRIDRVKLIFAEDNG